MNEVLEFFKTSQQTFAILLWMSSLLMLGGFVLTAFTADASIPLFLRNFIPADFSLNGADLLGIYGKVVVIFYLLIALIRAIFQRKPKSPTRLRTKIARAALACVALYIPIFLCVPFLKFTPGSAGFGTYGTVTALGIFTLCATLYAVAVTHGTNFLTDKLRQLRG